MELKNKRFWWWTGALRRVVGHFFCRNTEPRSLFLTPRLRRSCKKKFHAAGSRHIEGRPHGERNFRDRPERRKSGVPS